MPGSQQRRHAALLSPIVLLLQSCGFSSVAAANQPRARRPGQHPQVISKTSTLNPVAGYTLNAGGLEWAYRRNEIPAGSAEGGGSPDVLLLHGLGSSGYRWVCGEGALR